MVDCGLGLRWRWGLRVVRDKGRAEGCRREPF